MRPRGFEPLASASGGQRSIQLSYGRLSEPFNVRSMRRAVKTPGGVPRYTTAPGSRRSTGAAGHANKPSSVSTGVEEDHFSGTPLSGRLVRPTRDSVGADHPSSLRGLAPDGVCRATRCYQGPGALLPHPFTLACAPKGHRRSALCGTFHRLAAPGGYPASCPAELGLSSAGDRSPDGDPHSHALRTVYPEGGGGVRAASAWGRGARREVDPTGRLEGGGAELAGLGDVGCPRRRGGAALGRP